MQNIGEGELGLSQFLLLTSPKLRPQRQSQHQSQHRNRPPNPSPNPSPLPNRSQLLSQNRHRKPKESIKDFSQSPLFGGFFLFLGVMYYR